MGFNKLEVVLGSLRAVNFLSPFCGFFRAFDALGIFLFYF